VKTCILLVAVGLVATVLAFVSGAAAADRATIVAQAAKAVVVVDAGAVEGSAFAFGRPGDYLTNAHVVGNARRVFITDSRGRRRQARVIAIDKRTDVALLESKLVEPRLRAAHGSLRPGETVLTIGAAAGLPGTVTEGIVSAIGRLINGIAMIQTDAALNHGDSGGALINVHGDVVGVTSARQAGAEGIAFAIPIETARRAVRAQSAVHAAIRPAPSMTSRFGVPIWIVIGMLMVGAALLGGVAGWRLLLTKTRKAAARATVPIVVPDPVVVIRRRREDTDGEEESVRRTTEETWI
jgi:S1-C subfamily serine protease